MRATKPPSGVNSSTLPSTSPAATHASVASTAVIGAVPRHRHRSAPSWDRATTSDPSGVISRSPVAASAPVDVGS